jgi:glutaminase
VLELVGALTFAHADYVSRRIAGQARPAFVIIDLRRVPAMTEGAVSIFTEMIQGFAAINLRTIFSGLEDNSLTWSAISKAVGAGAQVRRFDLLDEAIEWTEDQLIYRHGGFSDGENSSPLDKQVLLAGLSEKEFADLTLRLTSRTFHTGERILAAGDPATSIFFILSGMVSVKLRSGTRLASLSHGMVFGEMALIGDVRSADVFADARVVCLELTMDGFAIFCRDHPHAGHRIVHNLATLLAKRLVQANAKVDLFSAY